MYKINSYSFRDYTASKCNPRHKNHQRVAEGIPDVLGGVPPLRRQLPALGVVDRGVQNGDAHISVLEKQQIAEMLKNKFF